MADQRVITLRAGESPATTIALAGLPLWEPVPNSAAYLYPVSAPVCTLTPDPRIIVMQAAATAAIDLFAINSPPPCRPSADIILMALPGPDLGGGIPPVSYYAVLRRWTGAAWAKAKLKAYAAAWAEKPLRVRAGGAWELVDATGV